MKKDLIFYFSLLLLSIILSYKTHSDYTLGVSFVLLFASDNLLRNYEKPKLTTRIALIFLPLLIGSLLIFTETGFSQNLYIFVVVWMIFTISLIIRTLKKSKESFRKSDL